ncbi:hypothetical protein [Microcystis aeruginosa]|uniref:hypothetical protein n=1 Tax=Microcystis aeruginosa TaxID=1126 RepID=UPI00103018D0|nr:hypothetical protein [Microcystis aeruginosa]
MLSYLISSQFDRINGYPLRQSAVDSQNLGDYPQEKTRSAVESGERWVSCFNRSAKAHGRSPTYVLVK